jgi:hypothetical protein
LPVLLGQTDPGAVIVAEGSGLIVIVALPLDVQPDGSVTSTLSAIDPDAPAVIVTAFVPVPAVIVPPVIDQAYVAPVVTGTLALIPVWFEQTFAGAVIVAVGSGVIGWVAVAEVLQPPVVSTRVKPTEPDVAAV